MQDSTSQRCTELPVSDPWSLIFSHISPKFKHWWNPTICHGVSFSHCYLAHLVISCVMSSIFPYPILLATPQPETLTPITVEVQSSHRGAVKSESCLECFKTAFKNAFYFLFKNFLISFQEFKNAFYSGHILSALNRKSLQSELQKEVCQ